MRDIRNLKDRATEYVRKCKEALEKLLKRLDFVSEKSVKNLEARADRAERRVISLESELERKDEIIADLKNEKEELSTQIEGAYQKGIDKEQKRWIKVVKHFDLDEHKEFRDYVNEKFGEDILDDPDRGMYFGR